MPPLYHDTRNKSNDTRYKGRRKQGYNSFMPIQNRLKVLMAEKSLREKRRLTYREVSQEADIPKSVLSLYVAQKVRRFDIETLEKLCKYFNIQPGDLLFYEEPEKTKTAHKHK